ncbi:MAG: CPBP family intramembrane glutamic endopeptidase, partial [Nitrososphaeraceae archaeon]|nr:CPBP family intramembrane glutamic endopeptidase [Nitrososphaeraceae archaeon]
MSNVINDMHLLIFPLNQIDNSTNALANIIFSYRAFSAILVSPVLEELFFRKFLFTGLLRKYSQTSSIIISSLCFSLIHLPQFHNLM